MNRQNQHIDSPAFKQLAYWALKRLTPEQKDMLSSEERKIFVGDYSVQRFCQEERMDRVLLMLANVGISWTLRIEKDAYEADMVEFITHDQYRYPQKRVDAIEATSRAGVCIISSRDVMNTSHMVAQNCNTKIYEITNFGDNLAKIGTDIQRLKTWQNRKERVQDHHDLLNDLLLEQMNAFVNAETVLGLSPNDIRILSALYKKRDGAIRMTDISTFTRSSGKKMYFRNDMQKLLDRKMVVCDEKDVKKRWANATYFMITELGIDRIIEYRKYILKNVFGT